MRGSAALKRMWASITLSLIAWTTGAAESPVALPAARLQGDFEFVYAYWRDHCDKLPPTHYCSGGGGMGGMCRHPPCNQDRMSGGCNIDIADSPSYAFRNASGHTTIMASMNRGSRAMVADPEDGLLGAKHVCAFYTNSSNNPADSMFATSGSKAFTRSTRTTQSTR